MDWNYAELSRAAKEAGGPEKFVDMLIESSKAKGRAEMAPFIGLAVIGGIGLDTVARKIIQYFKEKCSKSQKAIEEAREEIIKGIKEYDATHPDDAPKELST